MQLRCLFGGAVSVVKLRLNSRAFRWNSAGYRNGIPAIYICTIYGTSLNSGEHETSLGGEACGFRTQNRTLYRMYASLPRSFLENLRPTPQEECLSSSSSPPLRRRIAPLAPIKAPPPWPLSVRAVFALSAAPSLSTPARWLPTTKIHALDIYYVQHQ